MCSEDRLSCDTTSVTLEPCVAFSHFTVSDAYSSLARYGQKMLILTMSLLCLLLVCARPCYTCMYTFQAEVGQLVPYPLSWGTFHPSTQLAHMHSTCMYSFRVGGRAARALPRHTEKVARATPVRHRRSSVADTWLTAHNTEQ